MRRMKKLAPSDVFEDERGTIQDLLLFDPRPDGVTVIHTKTGAVRGNHWHAKTTQWTYLISGRLRVKVQNRFDDPGSEGVLEAGELMVSPPNEAHAWQAIEDSVCMVFTAGPRTGAD